MKGGRGGEIGVEKIYTSRAMQYLTNLFLSLSLSAHVVPISSLT